jgi:putative ABC transport system permease protein
MGQLLREVLHAGRRLARHPRYTLAAMFLLAVGISGNLAVLAVVHVLLIQPLPYAHPERLVRLWESQPARGIFRSPVSRGNFYDWRERAKSFEYIEAFEVPRDAVVSVRGGDPEIIKLASGTEHFMDLLGVSPFQGPNNGPQQLRLSYGFWQRRFGASAGIVGSTYTVEGFSSIPLTVGCVMPKGFDFPVGADAWTLLGFGRERSSRTLNVLARIAPGVSLQQAQAELDVLETTLAAEHPVENGGWRVQMMPLHDAIVGDVRQNVWLLYAAVCLMTLISLISVAGMALARRTQTERDTAIRLALGATGGRLRLAQLCECSILATAAGVLGIGLAVGMIRTLVGVAPASIPRLQEIAPGVVIVLMGVGIVAVVAALLFLLTTVRDELSMNALTVGFRDAGSGRLTALRSALTIGQIAFCVALLLLSIVVVQSFLRLWTADVGFEPQGLLAVQVRYPVMKAGEVVKHYPTRRFMHVTDELLDSVNRLPGVTSVAAAWNAPFLRTPTRQTTLRILEGPVSGPLTGTPSIIGADVRNAVLSIVTPSYFGTLRIRPVAGRLFVPGDRLGEDIVDDRDAVRGTGVAVVSEALARREWPRVSALGQYLAIGEASYRSVEVVGIVSDVKTGGGTSDPTIYLPYAQTPMGDISLLIRADADAQGELASTLRDTVREYGTDVSAFNLSSMDQLIARAFDRQRFSSAIMTTFACGGVVFTAAGLYSVLSFLVALRSRELAIRLAIGAVPSDLVRAVLLQGLRLATLGVIVGLGGAVLSRRLLVSFVPELVSANPATYVAVALLALAVAAVASYLPAQRASQIDPIGALRSE